MLTNAVAWLEDNGYQCRKFHACVGARLVTLTGYTKDGARYFWVGSESRLATVTDKLLYGGL